MDFLDHAVRVTLLISLFVIPLGAWIMGIRFAMGLLSGTLWSLANLWVLKVLMTRTFGSSPSPRWQKPCLFIVKFPLLYAVGGWMLLSSWGSPIGFVIGFSLWLMCLVLSALRQAPRDGVVVSCRLGK